jgi:hypothetical protein
MGRQHEARPFWHVAIRAGMIASFAFRRKALLSNQDYETSSPLSWSLL